MKASTYTVFLLQKRRAQAQHFPNRQPPPGGIKTEPASSTLPAPSHFSPKNRRQDLQDRPQPRGHIRTSSGGTWVTNSGSCSIGNRPRQEAAPHVVVIHPGASRSSVSFASSLNFLHSMALMSDDRLPNSSGEERDPAALGSGECRPV